MSIYITEDVVINCHFFDVSEIELDIDPREISTIEKANQVMEFIETLSEFTKHEVLLTPEGMHDRPILSCSWTKTNKWSCNLGEGCWYCPAVDRIIDEGLCLEYYMADRGGPTDTAMELRRWIKTCGKFDSLDEFHLVCEICDFGQQDT